MKRHLRLWGLLVAVATAFLSMVSCSDDEPGQDLRDLNLVGTWLVQSGDEAGKIYRIYPDGRVYIDDFDDSKPFSISRCQCTATVSGNNIELFCQTHNTSEWKAEIVTYGSQRYLKFPFCVAYFISEDPEYNNRYKYLEDVKNNVSCTIERDGFFYRIVFTTKLTDEMREHTRHYNWAFFKEEEHTGVSINEIEPVITVSGGIERAEYNIKAYYALAAISHICQDKGEEYEAEKYLDQYAEADVYYSIYEALIQKEEAGETLTESEISLKKNLVQYINEYIDDLWREDLELRAMFKLDDLLYIAEIHPV